LAENGFSESDSAGHDVSGGSFGAFMLAAWSNRFPQPVGTFRAVERDYEDLDGQIDAAIAKNGLVTGKLD